MDFNKLETFLVVAEMGSITAAAHSLRRSQSAISQQMQLLEEELGLKLLERRAGRIYLSSDGEKIYGLGKGSLGQLRDGILSLQHQVESVEGHITLGALNDSGTDFDVGKAIGDFCQHYPKVTFRVHTGTSPSLEADLVRNEVDLGLIIAFKDPSLFVRAPVHKSFHSLYTSTAYLKKTGPVRSCRDLLDKALIDLDDEFMGIGTFVGKNAKSVLPALRHRQPDIVAPNLEVAKQILVSGYGIAMLPDFLVASDVAGKRVVKLLDSLRPLHGILDVAYRTNRTLRLCEKLFIRHVTVNHEKFPLKAP